LAIDAGVVDHGVHRAKRVDLLCNGADLCGATQIADRHSGGMRLEVERRGPLRRARVEDHFVARVQERMRGRAAKTVSATRDEDARHQKPFHTVDQRPNPSSRPMPLQKRGRPRLKAGWYTMLLVGRLSCGGLKGLKVTRGDSLP